MFQHTCDVHSSYNPHHSLSMAVASNADGPSLGTCQRDMWGTNIPSSSYDFFIKSQKGVTWSGVKWSAFSPSILMIWAQLSLKYVVSVLVIAWNWTEMRQSEAGISRYAKIVPLKLLLTFAWFLHLTYLMDFYSVERLQNVEKIKINDFLRNIYVPSFGENNNFNFNFVWKRTTISI